MSLRRRVILILVLTALAQGLIALCANHFALRPGYEDLERVQAERSLRRAERVVELEARGLSLLCEGLTRELQAASPRPGDASRRMSARLLGPDALDGHDLDLILVAGRDGVDSFSFRDPATHRDLPAPPLPESLLVRFAGGASSGVLPSPRGPLLLAWRSVSGLVGPSDSRNAGDAGDAGRPVEPSQAAVPAARDGTLVLGRLLVGERLEALRTSADAGFSLVSASDRQALSPGDSASLDELERGAGRVLRAGGEAVIASSLKRDVEDRPNLLLQSVLPREIDRRGRDAAVLAAWIVFPALGLSALASLWLLRRSVIQPLSRLSERADEIGKSGDFSLRLPEPSGKEIAVLARRFNALLSLLERNHGRLEAEVGERTRELEMVNAALRLENARREAAEGELILAKEAAEAASRAKAEFLANMSHELRTPLTGVIGLTEMVLDGRLEAEQREYLKLVRQSATNLLRIIQDVMDLTELDTGEAALSERPFSPRALVRESLKPLANLAWERGVDFSVRFAPELPELIVADPGKLGLVLEKMAGNAVKFTRQGRVEVRVEPLAAGRGESGPRLLFTISDTGVGIAPDRLRAIFDRFTQGDLSSTKEFGGMGLGLTIADQLVRLMGGSVEVESREGEGSVFRFIVPCRPDEPDAAAIQAEAPARTVLILDENPISSRAAAILLEEDGLRARGAASGLEALDAMASESVDLVLADLRSDREDRLCAIRLLRAANPSLAVVALLDSAEVGELEGLLAAGVEDCLFKPFGADELRGVVTRLLDDRPARSADAA